MSGGHGDGEGDGVDLVVVFGVGEGTGFFDEVAEVGAADEEEFSFFGEGGPGEGPGDLVRLNFYAL